MYASFLAKKCNLTIISIRQGSIQSFLSADCGTISFDSNKILFDTPIDLDKSSAEFSFQSLFVARPRKQKEFLNLWSQGVSHFQMYG